MDLLQKLKGNNFLVVGRAGMDLFPNDIGMKTENSPGFTSALGGSSANIAVAICKLGGRAALVTTVSDDSVGRYCKNQLKHYGVSTEFVRTIGGEYRTSLALYESRIEDHQSVIYRNGAADFQMDMQDVEAPDYAPYSAVITTGTVFAIEPSRAAGYRALELANQNDVPVIFDIDYRPYSWASPEEAARVLRTARKLGQSENKIIVYKMGELGSITIKSGEEFQSGIYKVEAVKPTGAGDSFMGGFIASLAAGNDLPTSVLRGSAAAAIVVAEPGCAPAMADTARLDAFIADHPGPSVPTT